jgi:hypothetical protein
MNAIPLSHREVDVILRGLTFALDMGDTYFAFHPGEDYNEGDDAKDEEAKRIAQELRERLGNG